MESSTQHLRDPFHTGLPLLGGHLKTWMATAHLLCCDTKLPPRAYLMTQPPPLSARATSAHLYALWAELSPLSPPFYARHIPPTTMLQVQPDGPGTVYLLHKRVSESPRLFHTNISAHASRHQRTNVLKPKLLLPGSFTNITKNTAARFVHIRFLPNMCAHWYQ